MKAFELDDLLWQQKTERRAYLEFVRQSSMSVGLYTLPAGGVDRQKPHTEDEMYYVIRGRGVINVAGDDRTVQAGSAVFIAAGVEYFFHVVEEELVILVFFAPAEGTAK